MSSSISSSQGNFQSIKKLLSCQRNCNQQVQLQLSYFLLMKSNPNHFCFPTKTASTFRGVHSLLTMYSSHYKTKKQTPTKSKCIFMLFFNSNFPRKGVVRTMEADSRGHKALSACCCHYQS